MTAVRPVTIRPDDRRHPPAGSHAGTAWGWPDLIFLLLLAVFWVYQVTPLVTERRHGGDVLRDAASALNIRHGRVFSDPAYRGQTIWYPPLSPSIVAGASWLFRTTPLECYIWSQLLFNWLIPFGLYVVVRLQWGRRAAMGATIALLLALPWWQSSVCRGQASVHAVVWAWAAVLLYGRAQRDGSLKWASGCGLLQGVAFWHHPLLPGVLALGMVLQAGWAALRCPQGPDHRSTMRKLLLPAGVTLGLTLLAAAPMLYFMLHGPVLNAEPRHHLADELRTPEFPLMRYNLWIWATGLVGLGASIRGRDFGSRLLVVGLVLCALGQVPGYARIFGLTPLSHLPVVVPHEFQLAFQLGWAICVGIGLDKTVTWLAAGLATRGGRRAWAAVLTGVALALTGAWGWSSVGANLRRFLAHYGPRQPEFQQAAEWIRRNTRIDDLFMCDADLAFAWLGPQTGRKVWITGEGHSNPRVDWSARMRMLEETRALPSPEAFWWMMRERCVNYCIPSESWLPKVLADPDFGPLTVPAYLEPVFVAGKLHILRVVDP